MTFAQVVSMTVQGHTSFAVWLGAGIDPSNPKRITGARLLDVFSTRAAAQIAADDAVERAA